MAHRPWPRRLAAQLPLLLGAAALTSSCDLVKAGGGLMMEAVDPMTHLFVPFNAGTKGATATLELRVPKQDSYGFSLEYQYREGDTAEAERVLGLIRGADRNGPARDGLMIPVRVSIWREGQAPVAPAYDAVLTHQRFRGAGGSSTPGYNAAETGFTHAYAVLDPGRYCVRVEALEDVPALRDIPILFWLSGGGWVSGSIPAHSAP